MKAGVTWEEFLKHSKAKPLPLDHTVYSEPPSIMFLSRTSRQSEKKDTSSTPTGTPKCSELIGQESPMPESQDSALQKANSPSSDVKPSRDSKQELGFMEQLLADNPGLTREEALEMIASYGF